MICEHCGTHVSAGYGVYKLPGETVVCEECLYFWARRFFHLVPDAAERRGGDDGAR